MRPAPAKQFTLLELIVVLTLLVGLAAMTAPHLGGFFRGQQLDGQARQLWQLSRYAQAEAIARAVPMELWADPQSGLYGVQALSGFGYSVVPVEYQLPEELELLAEVPANDKAAAKKAQERLALIWWPDGSSDADNVSAWVLRSRRNPDDAWRLVRQSPLPGYTLVRQETTP